MVNLNFNLVKKFFLTSNPEHIIFIKPEVVKNLPLSVDFG